MFCLPAKPPGRSLVPPTRKGTNGFSTAGVTAIVMFFLTRTFWALPLTYLHFPKSARAYLSPQSFKMITFAAAPLVLTPFVRDQPWPWLRPVGGSLALCQRFVSCLSCYPCRNNIRWVGHVGFAFDKYLAHDIIQVVRFVGGNLGVCVSFSLDWENVSP